MSGPKERSDELQRQTEQEFERNRDAPGHYYTPKPQPGDEERNERWRQWDRERRPDGTLK